MNRRDLFVRSILRISLAILAKKCGYSSVQRVPLEALISIARHYVVFLGRTVSRLTDFSCRTQSNLLDVMEGFSELGINMQELIIFRLKCISSNSVFPYELPPPPLATIPRSSGFSLHHLTNSSALFYPPIKLSGSKSKETDSSLSLLIQPSPPSIPSFLPSFPPLHTYQYTPFYPNRLTDENEINKLKASYSKSMTVSVSKIPSTGHEEMNGFFHYDDAVNDEAVNDDETMGYDNEERGKNEERKENKKEEEEFVSDEGGEEDVMGEDDDFDLTQYGAVSRRPQQRVHPPDDGGGGNGGGPPLKLPPPSATPSSSS